jgi:hypothetical protein
MRLVLYPAPVTCALVPHVTLTAAGAEFEQQLSVKKVLAYEASVPREFARAA